MDADTMTLAAGKYILVLYFASSLHRSGVHTQLLWEATTSGNGVVCRAGTVTAMLAANAAGGDAAKSPETVRIKY